MDRSTARTASIDHGNCFKITCFSDMNKLTITTRGYAAGYHGKRGVDVNIYAQLYLPIMSLWCSPRQ